jgi:6-pyruvoyltetrahydropterin/6-carboxytetrahydropterin synthase
MFEIEKVFRFESGHTLVYHDGKCSSPHGHSYLLRVILRSEKLIQHGPKQSMMIDYQDISAIVKPMIETYFDHKWLNETLQTESPTAETIAQWVFEHLKAKLPQLYKITICETESSSASYTLT